MKVVLSTVFSCRNGRRRYCSLAKFCAQTIVLGGALMLLQGVAFSQAWHSESLDSGSGHDVGQFSALAVDHDGNLHAVYWDATGDAPRGQLWYAFRAPGDKQWSRMVVDQDGIWVSMAVDSSDHPHFVYDTRRETGLHYTYWDGKRWHRQVIDPGHTNYFTSIQLDSHDRPRISYYLYHLPTGEYSLHLKYANYDGKQWYIQTVDPRMHTGKMNALAVDRDGNPHIAYSYLGSTGDMLYAHWAESRWQFAAADLARTENTHLGYGNTIALDSKDHPHIAYFDDVKNNVKYASWEGGHWSTEVIDHVVSEEHLDRIALKIDRQDRPHVAYYDAGSGVLKYAVRGPSGWQREVVDRQGNVGLRPSLALDEHDQPYICYYDLTNHALRFAYRSLPPMVNVAVKK